MFIIIGFSCSSDKFDCKSIKTGAFKYNAKGWEQQCIIERNDSVQFEKLINSGMTVKTKVTWLDDCSYELKFISINVPVPDSILTRLRNTKTSVKIIKVGRDYYITKGVYDNGTIIDTFMRIQN